MVLYPARTASVLPFAVGCVLLLDSTLRLQTALDAKRFGLEGWYWLLILSIVTILCSIVLILQPFDGAKALMILLGICLIADGVQNLYSALKAVRRYH
jgi:uncharacterized membrane protein HdeD (DUF308 family)